MQNNLSPCSNVSEYLQSSKFTSKHVFELFFE